MQRDSAFSSFKSCQYPSTVVYMRITRGQRVVAVNDDLKGSSSSSPKIDLERSLPRRKSNSSL
jgi:hypothetical protein